MEYRKATNGSLNGDLFSRFKEELVNNETDLSVVKFCIPKSKKSHIMFVRTTNIVVAILVTDSTPVN